MFDSVDDFPTFGFSTWPWAPLPQGDSDCARDFYNAWMNFSTEKDFSWMEKWNLAEAPERRIRRSECWKSTISSSHMRMLTFTHSD